jgi:hypothetical protein
MFHKEVGPCMLELECPYHASHPPPPSSNHITSGFFTRSRLHPLVSPATRCNGERSHSHAESAHTTRIDVASCLPPILTIPWQL